MIAANQSEEKLDDFSTLNLSIGPGSSLGVGVCDRNSSCVVVNKKDPRSPLNVGDVIKSLNGVSLSEAGGMKEWKTLFASSADRTRNLVVKRPTNPPKDVEFEITHAHIKDEELLAYLKNVTSVPVETFLEGVRLGKFIPTRAINSLKTSDELIYLSRLVDGGLIQVIIGLLKECHDKTFSEAISSELHEGEKIIDGPAEWLAFLTNFVGSPICKPQS